MVGGTPEICEPGHCPGEQREYSHPSQQQRDHAVASNWITRAPATPMRAGDGSSRSAPGWTTPSALLTAGGSGSPFTVALQADVLDEEPAARVAAEPKVLAGGLLR